MENGVPPHFHKIDRIQEQDLIPNSTILTALPQTGQEGERCVVLSGGVYTFYQYLNGSWRAYGGLSLPLSIADGGTGASDAATALSNLGAASAVHTHSAAQITSGTMATARLGSGTANGSTFLRGDQTWATPPTASSLLVTVTAGEQITAGEVVRLYVAGGNYLSKGYDHVTGDIYAIRAAANDTTYGKSILGFAYEDMDYLGTGQVLIAGDISVLSGLSGIDPYYLDNYSSGSSLTISQTSQDAEQSANGNTFIQIFSPTSSRLDKVVLKLRKNGGSGMDFTVQLKRSNTVLATSTASLLSNSLTLSDTTFDFSDVQTYKGELLNLSITNDSSGGGTGYIGYQSTGDVYAPVYDPSGSSSGIDLIGTGIPASGADLYMKVYEYTNFGKISTTAGSRKIKLGIPLSATDLALQLQYADSLL